MKTRGAVIVTRVSTGEQVKHGTSLESQLEACRAKALSLGLPIFAEYEDAGISGSFLLSREGMQNALSDIQNGRADTLICANLSRYSRDVEHQQQIKKSVRNAGGRVVFCDMDFDDTPEGDLAFNIMGGFAEYERKVIRKRTMDGRRALAEKGVQVGRSWSPYGYNLVKRADIIKGLFPPEQLGQYIINEGRSKVVKWMFASFAGGEHTLQSLCRELNFRHIPTAQGATLWSPQTVRGILKNPVYIGRPAYGRMTCRHDEHRLQQISPATGERYKTIDMKRPSDPQSIIELSAPALVDELTWHAVEQRLSSNQQKRGGNPARVTLLSGIGRCPKCGGPMLRNGGGQNRLTPKPPYYQCRRRKERQIKEGVDVCQKTGYRSDIFEAAVIDAVLEACTHPEALAAAVQTYREAATPDQSTESQLRHLEEIEKELKELSAREDRLLELQLSVGASPTGNAAFVRKFADVAARREELASERIKILGTVTPIAKQPARDTSDEILSQAAMADVACALRSTDLTEQERRSLLTRLVDFAVPTKEGAEVHFLSGVLPLDQTIKLFKKTFLFTGGEIVGEFLMSCGYLPGAHDETCPVYARIAALEPAWMRV